MFWPLRRVNVLFLEWSYSGTRDSEAIIKLRSEISSRGYTCAYKTLILSGFYILYYRPSLIFLSNCSGSVFNWQALVFAKLFNVRTVTSISEGDVVKQRAELMLWSRNQPRFNYIDSLCLWSKYQHECFQPYLGSLNQNVKICGSLFHDRFVSTPSEIEARKKRES